MKSQSIKLEKNIFYFYIVTLKCDNDYDSPYSHEDDVTNNLDILIYCSSLFLKGLYVVNLYELLPVANFSNQGCQIMFAG